MTRESLKRYIEENYSVEADYPWRKHPSYEVFRHISTGKWFAVIMTITADKLGMDCKDNIDIVNLKCDDFLGESVKKMAGVFPAYHMNKQHWISVALDGSVDNDTIEMLLDMSYKLTGRKNMRKIL